MPFKFGTSVFHNRVIAYLTRSLSRIKTEDDVLKKSLAYSYILNESILDTTPNSSLGSYSLIYLLGQTKFNKTKSEVLKQKDIFARAVQSLVSDVFSHGIKNITNNGYLKVLYAYETLRNEKNTAKACSLISSIKRNWLSWRDSLLHYHIQQESRKQYRQN